MMFGCLFVVALVVVAAVATVTAAFAAVVAFFGTAFIVFNCCWCNHLGNLIWRRKVCIG